MLSETLAKAFIKQIADDFNGKPFIPHPIFKRGDLQTLSAYFWPGRFHSQDLTNDRERLFEVEPGSRVLARCRWQAQPVEHPTLLIWHGMEGSTSSAYMLTTAHKAFLAGFNVLRINFRNCGNTEHLSPTLYHAGLTSDSRAIIGELTKHDRLKHLFLAGFSLGGNMVLKLAGEYGDHPPTEVKGVCAVSPSADLRASMNLMTQPRNWIYHQSFLRRLKARLRTKARLFPAVFDTSGLQQVRSIEQFDNRFVAPAFGFADANDYYSKASSLPYIERIRIPTLIIHAQDDPFIPFAPLRDTAIASNPYVLLLAPERGGHVAFICASSSNEDRFWAENRLVEFCRFLAEKTSDDEGEK